MSYQLSFTAYMGCLFFKAGVMALFSIHVENANIAILGLITYRKGAGPAYEKDAAGFSSQYRLLVKTSDRDRESVSNNN